MFKFNFKYLLWAALLFVIEVIIAAYMHDDFIRPTFGDFLVVMLMYCGLKTFLTTNYRIVAVAVLLISYAIEISQYFHLIVRLGWQHSTLAKMVLGNGFSWGDMLAYTLGVAVIWLIEYRLEK